MPFTAIVTMADEAGGTRYVTTVMHPDRSTRDKHEAMGFHEGWGTCIEQLDACALTLKVRSGTSPARWPRSARSRWAASG